MPGQAAFQRFTELGAATPRQTLSGLTPQVISQLPPEVRDALRSLGVGANEPVEVLSPTESRTHYLRLGVSIDRYRKRYQRQLKPIFDAGPVHWILTEQRDRLREYQEEYARALRAGADPIAALNEWCRNVIASMSSAHPRFLDALAEAREESNGLTQRHWLSTAGLITLVPEAHRAEEIAFLKRQAALSSMHYTGSIVQWYTVGLRAIVLDRELTDIMAAGLHEAARARELEALLARERMRREQEAELEDGEELDVEVDLWIGLDLGVFSIKVQADEVELSLGEGLIGEATCNWGDQEIEMGIGLGYDAPTAGLLGGGGKALGVVRLGGEHGAALGIRECVEATVGTPVAGAEIDVLDEYLWIASAGRPNEALF